MSKFWDIQIAGFLTLTGFVVGFVSATFLYLAVGR